MPRPSTVALAVVAPTLVAAAVLAGCGGVRSSARSSSATSMSDALVARARSICRRLDDEVTALVKNAHTSRAEHGPSTEETLQLMRARGTAERAALAQLNGLAVQPSTDADWQRILSDKRSVGTTMWQLGLAELHHDRSRERVLTAVLRGIESHLKAVALRHKLAVCATPE